jgi:hypothetical protein
VDKSKLLTPCAQKLHAIFHLFGWHRRDEPEKAAQLFADGELLLAAEN